MKTTLICVAMVTIVFGLPSFASAQNANSSTTMETPKQSMNPNMGTWKLNEAKSKFGAGAPKNHTVVYEPEGDMVKVTVDGVDAAGTATHSEWTGKFDGKYYAVTGEGNSDMRAYRRINSRTLGFTGKMGDKITLTGRIMVSRDGRTRTVTTTSTNAAGKKVMTTAVYDKQ